MMFLFIKNKAYEAFISIEHINNLKYKRDLGVYQVLFGQFL